MKILCAVIVSLTLNESAWAQSAVRCYTGIKYWADKSKGDDTNACEGKTDRYPKMTSCLTVSGFQGVCGYYVAEDLNNRGCYPVVGYCSTQASKSLCESYAYTQSQSDASKYNGYNTKGPQTFSLVRSKCCGTNDCNTEALDHPKEAKAYIKKGSGEMGVGTIVALVVVCVVIAIIIALCVLLNYLKRVAKHKKKMAKMLFKQQQHQMEMQQRQQFHQASQPVTVTTTTTSAQPMMASAGAVRVVAQPMAVPQTQAMGAPVMVSAYPQTAPVTYAQPQPAPMVVSAQPQTAPMIVSAQAQPVYADKAPSHPVTVVATAL